MRTTFGARPKHGGDAVRLRAGFAAPHDRAGFVDHANGRHGLGNIKPDILTLFHGVPPVWRFASRKLPTIRPARRRDYAMSRPQMLGGIGRSRGQGRMRAALGGRLRRSCVLGMPSVLWGWKSPVQPDGGEARVKRKGGTREGPSEGSVARNRGSTNRNRIRGKPGRTSGQEVGKSISIKGQAGKSGGRARKDAELTPGDLHRVRPGSQTD